jgi:hypothetical protein
MPRVTFTANLRRHFECPSADVPGSTVGETLAMGSTTGSLWLSRNSGESWNALSRDLPPVYCVRFAS